MTREQAELGEQAWIEGELGKGPFDPDMLGYPGEPIDLTGPVIIIGSDKMDAIEF